MKLEKRTLKPLKARVFMVVVEAVEAVNNSVRNNRAVCLWLYDFLFCSLSCSLLGIV